MSDWYTEAYEAEHRRRYEEIRAKHPSLVTLTFSCHTGWFGILDRLFDEMEEILRDGEPEKFGLRQVKEKLGGLRVYYRYGESRADEREIWHRLSLAVFAAECRSERTCEVCGRPGLMRVRGGWWATRCEEHGADMEPRPTAERQAASRPRLERSDGTAFVYDPAEDRVKEVRDDDD